MSKTIRVEISEVDIADMLRSLEHLCSVPFEMRDELWAWLVNLAEDQEHLEVEEYKIET